MGQAFVLQDPTQPLSPRCDCKVAKIPWSTPPHTLVMVPRVKSRKAKRERRTWVLWPPGALLPLVSTQPEPSVLTVRPVRVQPCTQQPCSSQAVSHKDPGVWVSEVVAPACPRGPFKPLSPKNLSSQLPLPGLRSGSRAHPPSQLLPSSFLPSQIGRAHV